MTTSLQDHDRAVLTTSGPVLQVRDVVRRFGDLTAVDGASFHIDPGETYGLLGPNGAGKTTTISMVAGLIAADSGEVTVMGRPMTPTEVDAKRHIGLVPQDLAVYPDLHDGTLVDVLPQLGVLAGMAAVLLALGSWALRRSTARAL